MRDDIQRFKALEAQIADLQKKDQVNTDRIRLLQGDLDKVTLLTPPLPNQIDGGEFEYSKDLFYTNPPAGGDPSFECFNWYRQTQATTALAESSANALKYTGHSLYAANEGANGDIPRWDKTNGYAELGSVGGTNHDIAAPFPTNIAQPSVPLYIQFVAKRRTSTAWPAAAQMYAGIWDNTLGLEKYITGGPFTLTATKTGSHTAGATTYQYKIIATTDWGLQYESTTDSEAACLSTLDGNNYVSLSWDQIVGTVDYSIYEKKGSGNVFLIWQVQNGSTDYFRNGTTSLRDLGTTSFPTVSSSAPLAYSEMDENGANPFAPSDTEWKRCEIKVTTPASISAVGTGKQWLRLGLTAATTDARQVLIDRVGVCLQSGAGWSRSANDLRAANPTPAVSTTTGTIGDTGTGGGYEGDPRCLTYEMPVRIVEDGKLSGMPAEFVKPGDVVLTRSGKERKIRFVRFGPVQNIFRLETENGYYIRASATEPIMRSMSDKKGKRIAFIEEGEMVLTYHEGAFVQSRVVKCDLDGKEPVVMITLEGDDPTFIAGSHPEELIGGIVAHNRKIEDGAVF